MNIREAIDKLVNRIDLSEADTIDVMNQIMTGEATPLQVAAFLTALRMKGETVEEITGAARVMREKAHRVNVGGKTVLDTCGTGGDQKGYLQYFYHRGVRRRRRRRERRQAWQPFGIEPIGQRRCARALSASKSTRQKNGSSSASPQIGIGFLFAPLLHEAMKYAVSRAAISAFARYLIYSGPLTNPAMASHQLIGIYSGDLVGMIANVLKNLGSVACHGRARLGRAGRNFPLRAHQSRRAARWPGEGISIRTRTVGFKRCRLEDLHGGSAEQSAAIVRGVFAGDKGPGARRGFAQQRRGALRQRQCREHSRGDQTCRGVDRFRQGAAKAPAVGRADQRRLVNSMAEILATIAEHVRGVVERAAARPAVVGAARAATITMRRRAVSPSAYAAPPAASSPKSKKASPSKGLIRADFDAVAIAKDYATHGASAISVLTEERFFHGDLTVSRTDSRRASRCRCCAKISCSIPINLIEAKSYGADAVLFIAAMLDPDLMRRAAPAGDGIADWIRWSKCIGKTELAAALDAGAQLIGINNRDLKTFAVILATTERLAPLVPPGMPAVCESGIDSIEQIRRVEELGIHAFLIGESLMRAPAPGRS